MRLIDADALLELVQFTTPINNRTAEVIARCVDTTRGLIEAQPTIDAVEVVHGRWEDGKCSNCREEALSTSWDEPIYDYDWEENLRYSYTEKHTEYHLTDYCPNCGAKMDGGENG